MVEMTPPRNLSALQTVGAPVLPTTLAEVTAMPLATQTIRGWWEKSSVRADRPKCQNKYNKGRRQGALKGIDQTLETAWAATAADKHLQSESVIKEDSA